MKTALYYFLGFFLIKILVAFFVILYLTKVKKHTLEDVKLRIKSKWFYLQSYFAKPVSS